MPDYKKDNLRGEIIYGTGTSKNYGCIIEKVPTLGRPARRSTAYTVPGRNGSILMQEETFEDIQKTYSVVFSIDDKNRLIESAGALCTWLYTQRGYQRLEDNFEPDVFRLAYFNGPIDIENLLMMYGRADINFMCRPERFLKAGEKAVEVQSGSKLYNPTGYTSKPLIYLEGTGACSITVGSKTMEVSLTDYINIDCDAMNAYRQATENANALIAGSFPELKRGENEVIITGNITKATIRPNYYTL